MGVRAAAGAGASLFGVDLLELADEPGTSIGDQGRSRNTQALSLDFEPIDEIARQVQADSTGVDAHPFSPRRVLSISTQQEAAVPGSSGT